MKTQSSILILFCIVQLSFAQTKTEIKEIYNDAEYFFLREDYTEAFYYYAQLLKYYPHNSNFNFKAGSCLLNLPRQEAKAIPYLEKAIKEINVNYNKRSFNETGAPLHALYYLGNAYRINNEIEKALEKYNEFIESPEYYGNYNERMVQEEIKSCERAQIIKDTPIKIKSSILSEKINTTSDDYHAVVSGDGNTIIYITSLKFYEGLFYCKKKDGVWNYSQNINSQVVSDGDMFPTGISYDGTELLLVKKADVNNDIYYSKLVDGIWTEAEFLSKNINSKNNEDFASFSKDGKYIYFTSDRRGGNGGFDIYKSELLNGEWQKPVNLGDIVNSPFNEKAPFISEDGTRLFFSSDGHFTMGGYDIFYSELKNSLWKRPVNIGFPLNTTGDNIFFVPKGFGISGYASLTKDDGYGGQDIYFIEVKGSSVSNDEMSENDEVFDKKNSVMIKLLNEETSDTSIIWFDKSKNSFHFNIPENMKVVR